jgi:hypothetical protein
LSNRRSTAIAPHSDLNVADRATHDSPATEGSLERLFKRSRKRRFEFEEPDDRRTIITPHPSAADFPPAIEMYRAILLA